MAALAPPGPAMNGDNSAVSAPATAPVTSASVASAPPDARHNPRWRVATRVAEAVRGRWGGDVRAIGVYGSLAHGDDTGASDVDLVVVMKPASAGPSPGTRRIDAIIVNLDVLGEADYLRHARTLTTSWPLTADQFITTRALHDPDRWLPRLRDTHLARLAQADTALFATLAREAWCRAMSAQTKARRLADRYETETAALILGEARLGTALVEGLLTQTYFRNVADAVRRTGVAGAQIFQLEQRLLAQSSELARRGCPVDAQVDDLLGPVRVG